MGFLVLRLRYSSSNRAAYCDALRGIFFVDNFNRDLRRVSPRAKATERNNKVFIAM